MDMLAYCGHIIEHSPVLGEQAHDHYKKAFDEHSKNMWERSETEYAKSGEMENHIDPEFWPKPKKVQQQYREDHDLVIPIVSVVSIRGRIVDSSASH